MREVAEITVRPKGDLKVDRVTVALDTRHMVNPLTIAEQTEGGVIFGLTAALYGKITIKNGVPVQGNFDTYRMVRLAEAPKIDVHLVPSGGKAGAARASPARRRSPAVWERDIRRHRQTHAQPADHGPRFVGLGQSDAAVPAPCRRHEASLPSTRPRFAAAQQQHKS